MPSQNSTSSGRGRRGSCLRCARSHSSRGPRTRRRQEANPRTQHGFHGPPEDVHGKTGQPRTAHVLQAAAQRGVNRGPCPRNRSAEISESVLAAQRPAGCGGWDVNDKVNIRIRPRKHREGVRAIRPRTNAGPHRAEGTGGCPVAGEMPRGAQVAYSTLEHKPTRQKSGGLMPNPRERHGRIGRPGGHRDTGVVSSEKTIIADE